MISAMRLASIVCGLAVAILVAPAACADWRDEISVLRVGVMAGDNSPYRMIQFESFRLYLESRLAITVEIVPVENYTALIDAHVTSRVDYAIYSATAFSTAALSCDCVEPLVLPTGANGETGFHALLITRADSRIKSLADAKGTRLALAGPDSIGGRMMQLEEFEQEGINPQTYFARVFETENPELAISMLLAGEADLSVAWSSMAGDASVGYSFGILARMVALEELSMDQIRIVWQSPLIPFGPHAVRSDLPDDLTRLLSHALVAMAFESPEALDAVDRSGGRGMVVADRAMYAPIEALISLERETGEGSGSVSPR